MSISIKWEKQASIALTALQWSLSLVILIEAVLFLIGLGSHQEFSKTHLPGAFRFILGWGEIAGAVLLLVPRAVLQGAWLLSAILVLAIAVHLLHSSTNIGALIVYFAAAWAVAAGKKTS